MFRRPITSVFHHARKLISSLYPECEPPPIGDVSFLNADIGTKVSPDSEGPQDQAVDQQFDESHSDRPELKTASRDDDDALLEVRMSTDLPRRRCADDGNRSSCQRKHLPHYSTMRRYVLRGSSLPRVDNMLEPPSPLTENPLESSVLPPDSSGVKPHVPPDPPMITSVEKSDLKPNPDNVESSEGTQRRTIVAWFRTMMNLKSGTRSRTAAQTASEESPQTGTPPSNEKPSTISYTQRVKVRSTCCP